MDDLGKQLRTLIRHGTLPQAAAAIGTGPKHLARQLSRGSLSLARYGALLRRQNQEPAWRHSATLVSIRDLGFPDPSFHDDYPFRQVLKASAALAGSPREPHLDLKSLPEPEDPLSVDTLQGLSNPLDGLAHIPGINRLNLRDPGSTIRLARILATRLATKPSPCRQLFVEATGVLSSAYRLRGELRLSSSLLAIALLESLRAGLHLCTARLLRRAAYVQSDRYRYDAALSSLTQAALLYQESWDLPRLAKTMADRGMVLSYKGDYAEAAETLQHALAILPEDRPYKLLVLQGLATCAAALEDLASAREYLQRAEEFVDPDQPLSATALTLEQANLAQAAGEALEALRLYRLAREGLKENPLHVALVTVEILSSLHQAGARSRQLREETRRLLFTLEPISTTSQGAAVQGFLSRLLVEQEFLAAADLQKVTEMLGETHA